MKFSARLAPTAAPTAMAPMATEATGARTKALMVWLSVAVTLTPPTALIVLLSICARLDPRMILVATAPPAATETATAPPLMPTEAAVTKAVTLAVALAATLTLVPVAFTPSVAPVI